jgi:hypothetical protein
MHIVRYDFANGVSITVPVAADPDEQPERAAEQALDLIDQTVGHPIWHTPYDVSFETHN